MIYWLIASLIEDRGVYETLHVRTWMHIRNRYGCSSKRRRREKGFRYYGVPMCSPTQ
ncbi:hypothetical protein K439DRAFT_1641701 [Ramaria rubella]|nr:hypothetical protein K439DRAFT_1641701 [Ramaria rubella]